MKYFNRKPTKIINKPDLSTLDNLFAQIPSNFAPTPTAKSMKATRPSTPMLDALVNTPKAAAKPGIHVSGSTVAPAPIPSAAPAASTTASESRIASAVLEMLQKSLGKTAQTGLAPLLTAAAARHDAAISAKLADQAKGQKVVPNSHLTGLQRLIANANSKGDSSKSSSAPNPPVRI
jgi:hypothetical protein